MSVFAEATRCLGKNPPLILNAHYGQNLITWALGCGFVKHSG